MKYDLIPQPNGTYKMIPETSPPKTINTKKIVKWKGSKNRIYLAGDPDTINDLYLSAANWGAIDGDNSPTQLSETYSYFTIGIMNFWRWRLNVEFLHFDERLKSAGFRKYIKTKIRAWWNSIGEQTPLEV